VGVCSEIVREEKANMVAELPLPHSQFLSANLLQLNKDTHCDSHILRSKYISYSTGPKQVGSLSKAVGCLLKNKQRSILVIKSNDSEVSTDLTTLADSQHN
jgi:hypothetical protein